MSARTPRRLGGALLFASLLTVFSAPASAQGFPFFPSDRSGAIYQPSDPEAAPADADQPSTALRRQVVSYPNNEASGTIIIDTGHTFLYLTLGSDKALRYGIGVGREGFTWTGVERISRKAEWPDWIPPTDMISRQPYLPRWVAGGPGNPLGARALYLGNTDYRIHGTNDPASIGKHMSSGCIRLLNEDVIDLFNRVGLGTKVIVLPNAEQISEQPPTKSAEPLQTRTASRSHTWLSGIY
jgi:lipoprotein-anchoring transpeptidase ErfK/SrfK